MSGTAGRIFAIVGPSGAGKDTLMRAVQAARPEVVLAQRSITRPLTKDSEAYASLSQSAFEAKQQRGGFALSWQAHGLSYGIPSSVFDALHNGQTVFFNGSRAMLSEAARVFPDLHVLNVTASNAVLAERLRARGRESEAEITRRLKRARMPLPSGLRVTQVVNSGALADAVATVLAVLDQAAPQANSGSAA